MKTSTSLRGTLFAATILSGILAACAPPAPAVMADKVPTTEAMTAKVETATPDAMMEKETPTGGDATHEGAMAMPGFFAVPLRDAATSQDFTLADFKGKVVLLEPFAQWCPTCLRQQQQVAALHDLLGMREDFVSVGLDIDPNEDEAMLREYLSRNGFDWWYAVAPPQVASEIGELYGSQYLTPPSAPMLVIDRHGEVHPLPPGVKSAEDLLTRIEPFLAEAL